MINYPSFNKLAFNGEKKILVVFICFFLLNILQAVFTPLLNDEAYYWVFSQNMDWGYLDHPPLIAFLIMLSSRVLPGEIGVRLFCVILGSFTFFFLFKIIIKESKAEINCVRIVLLLGGSIFLNLYSFLAIPDTPLLFFGVMFFWFFQKFLKEDKWQNVLALGLVIPLLLYSKYHGILIIGFSVLAYPEILKRKSFYLIFLIALALFTPYIYWLIENDFRTIRFQFLESRSVEFDINNIFSYVGEQFLITGPIILLLFSILYKPENTFQKVLKYNVVGIFIFFLFSTFKGSVYTHWTAIAWLPMLILTYLYMNQKNTISRLIKSLLILNFLIVLVLRLSLIFNWFVIMNINNRNPKLLTETLRRETKLKPLVFQDMYIEPSLFMFYQKQNCFAINNLGHKRTQFNYWAKYEKEVQGKTVNLISPSKLNDSSVEIKIKIKNGGTYFMNMMADFRSCFTTVEVEAMNLNNKINAGKNYTIQYLLKCNLNNEEKEQLNTKGFILILFMINNRTREEYTYRGPLDLCQSGKSELEIVVPAKKGNYRCTFLINNEKYPYLMGFNSKTYYIRVE